MTGWLKIHRQLLDSPIFENEKLFKVFMYCLMKASHKEHKQLVGKQIVTLKPGQFVFGRKKASAEANMSASTLWSYMLTLKNLETLDIKSNNKFSVVTIVNWAFYQHDDKNNDSNMTTNEQQRNNKWTTNKQQMDTNKNDKNENNEKNEKKRDMPEYNPEVFDVLESRGVDIKNPNIALKISNRMNDIDDIQYLHEAINIAERKGVMKDIFVNKVIENWIEDGKTTYADLLKMNQKQNNSTPVYGTPNSQEQKDAYSHFDF